MLQFSRRPMREELSANEELLFNHQKHKFMVGHGVDDNRHRHLVKAGTVIFWYLMALVMMDLWLLRLLGYIELPW